MKVIFDKGKIVNQGLGDPSGLIFDLRSEMTYLHSLKIKHIIDFFDCLSNHWQGNKKLEKKAGGSLKHLSDFIRRDNVVRMLNFALRGDYLILDKFVDLGQPKYLYHCQPRGLAVHWLAGNVPLLGLYSIFQAMFTKNASLVKASNYAYKELLVMLESIGDIKTKNINGIDLLNSICVVLVDNDDTERHTDLSKAADIRIAWGGHDAIDAISSLEKNIFCEDIIYGPKYSYGVIDGGSLRDYKKIAQRLAFDVCTFDQYACSSPHTIFVEESNTITIEKFAKELADNIDFVTKKFIPKASEDPEKRSDILTVRAKYSMLGKVFSSENLDWTVICSGEEGLAEPCSSRVIYIKPIKNLSELKNYNNRGKQTLGCAITGDKREEVVDEVTLKGIDRCPKFGDMTLYESPWDGFFAIDRMVRWVSLYKNERN